MAIYRGDTPLKAYKGDMQPVNIYKGGTKVAGWHSQTVSGTGVVSLDGAYNVPPDALVIDGKCAQTVGVWGTNLVTNGDFSNGTTGWDPINSGMSISEGKANFLATAQWGRIVATMSQATIVDHVYYSSVKVTIPAANVYYVGITNYEIYIPARGEQTVSFTKVATSVQTKFVFGDNRASGWQTASIDNVLTIDLTAAFGAGNEPTAAQMDAYLAAYPNSWFNTTGLLTTSGTPNSPSPTYPAPITTITGDLTITGANGAASDTATIPLGAVELCSLPDGTKDDYNAVTGIVTKRCGKAVLDGGADETWLYDSSSIRLGVPVYVFKTIVLVYPTQSVQTTHSDRFLMFNDTVVPTIKMIAPSGTFVRIQQAFLAGASATDFRAWLAANPVTVIYKLATPTTTQLTPDLPVVRTGIKSLSVSGNITPTFTATVKAMDD